jgi:hypothetical protein
LTAYRARTGSKCSESSSKQASKSLFAGFEVADAFSFVSFSAILVSTTHYTLVSYLMFQFTIKKKANCRIIALVINLDVSSAFNQIHCAIGDGYVHPSKLRISCVGMVTRTPMAAP